MSAKNIMMAAAGNSDASALYSDDVFSTYLYTGNGATQTINNGIDLAGKGGMVWIKCRTADATYGLHRLFDTARGVTKYLNSALTNAEATDTKSVTSFSSTGFSLGFDAYVNKSGNSFTSWTFRRAPGFFDVVCDIGTGAAHTVSHGLRAVPEILIRKGRSVGTQWEVYSAALANTEKLVLNSTAAKATDATAWNSTTPTASVFTVGTGANVNTSAAMYVTYLFASLPGISKVGTYTGNGTSQTINCGFTTGARFILIKRTDSTGDWYVWDTARGIVSANDPHLSLNTTALEVTTDDSIDPNSSGFIVNQVSATNINVSGATYLYLAIA